MNDHELLASAAAAVGDVVWDGSDTNSMCRDREGSAYWWRPLDDAGDALRLAVSLCMPVDITDEETVISGLGIRVPHNGDPLSATCRAIVIAAAEMNIRGARE